MSSKYLIWVLLFASLMSGILGVRYYMMQRYRQVNVPPSLPIRMQLSSPAFNDGEQIPTQYTCDGANVSPPLQITDVPTGTKSLALIMWDPDVPKNLRSDGNFDHWIVFNIPPTITEISEDVRNLGVLGVNTRGDSAYVGPCPPDREHRYFFRLYALDTVLSLDSEKTKGDLEQAMAGHILDQATLIGRYVRH